MLTSVIVHALLLSLVPKWYATDTAIEILSIIDNNVACVVGGILTRILRLDDVEVQH